MDLMGGVNATHYLDTSKGYSLCGVDTFDGNLEATWTYVDCWECRAIADEWDGVSEEDMMEVYE